MPLKSIRKFTFCFLAILFVSNKGFGQVSLCPPNIDFKLGDFTNWECLSGVVSGVGGVNTVTWLTQGPDASRHNIIPVTSTNRDAFGNFPVQCPGSTTPSVKLGSSIAGHEADGLFYTFTIPVTATKFSLLYQYAVVLQNPGHQTHEQPRFRARIIDILTDQEVNCVSFDFTSSGSLPGFMPSPVSGSVIYKDWSAVSVDLSAYAGKAIRLEFITTDCVFQEHFGYAYINVASICNGSIIGSNYCEGESATLLTAPFGFETYQWFSDNTFSQEIGNSQSLQLSVNTTPVGSVLPVIIHPYAGYGCVDTLYATIGAVPKPVAEAGNNVVACSKAPAVLGTASNNMYEYLWTMPHLLNNPNISNPSTITQILTPTDFTVKTTDVITGCFDLDTVTVTPVIVDTSSSNTGEMLYCPGETPSVFLQVNNPSSQVQWFRDNTLIPGATSLTYEPANDGTYWARIRQGGCTDTSRQFNLHKAPLPKPDFVSNRDIQCLNKPVVFSNRTTIANNEPVTYFWQFSDGVTATDRDFERTFSREGNYTVTLTASSGADCIETITKTISVIRNCDPVLPNAFTPNRDGKNDDFKPSLMAAKGLKRFAVYNRWGNLVFATTKEGVGWDGTNKGVPIQTGVYVWTLEYINVDNKPVVEKGTVTLIR